MFTFEVILGQGLSQLAFKKYPKLILEIPLSRFSLYCNANATLSFLRHKRYNFYHLNGDGGSYSPSPIQKSNITS